MRRQNLNFLVFFAVAIFLMPFLSTVQAGTVSGTMLLQDGKPIVGGVGIFFDSKNGPAPVPSKNHRPPEYVYTIDDDGEFQVELAAGSYYLLGAIEAKPGSGRDEHLFFLIMGENDAPLLIEVPPKGLVELGIVMQEESISNRPQL